MSSTGDTDMSMGSSPINSFDSDIQAQPRFRPDSNYRAPTSILPSSERGRSATQSDATPFVGSGFHRGRRGPTSPIRDGHPERRVPPAPTLGSSENARHIRRPGPSTVHIVTPPVHDVGSEHRPRRLTVTASPYEVPSSPFRRTAARELPRSAFAPAPPSPPHILPSSSRVISRRSTIVLAAGPDLRAHQGEVSPPLLRPMDPRPQSALRPPPLSAHHSRSWPTPYQDSNGTNRRPRSYTDTGDRLQLRENMLAIVPPSREGVVGSGGLISMAVSRLISRSDARHTPPPHLNSGRRSTSQATMVEQDADHSRAGSGLSNPDATLVEEYTTAKVHQHAPPFYPGQQHELANARMRSVPALRALSSLPQGPLPELPRPPPGQPHSPPSKEMNQEDTERSSGESQSHGRQHSAYADEDTRDDRQQRPTTPVLGSSQPFKKLRSNSPPTNKLASSLQTISPPNEARSASHLRARLPSMSELGLIAQMRIAQPR
ncbi:hypothetical protein CF327_g1074 [Tilletia walkeri]|nr:hypothetical protein CF327_g1074 [Tilletia walkeri]